MVTVQRRHSAWFRRVLSSTLITMSVHNFNYMLQVAYCPLSSVSHPGVSKCEGALVGGAGAHAGGWRGGALVGVQSNFDRVAGPTHPTAALQAACNRCYTVNV